MGYKVDPRLREYRILCSSLWPRGTSSRNLGPTSSVHCDLARKTKWLNPEYKSILNEIEERARQFSLGSRNKQTNSAEETAAISDDDDDDDACDDDRDRDRTDSVRGGR